MYLVRPIFDRFARFDSWGSTRETLAWEDLCCYEISIPDIEIQQDIVNIFNAPIARKKIADQLTDIAKMICPILIKGLLTKRRARERGKSLMSYYTERHGMRTPVERTSTISKDMYALIFACCEKHNNNIAWLWPDECLDGQGCCGLDYVKFNSALRFEIPTLYRDSNGRIVIPGNNYNSRNDDYDQYALLDYIEFIGQNCRDIVIGSFHSYLGHYHIRLFETDEVFAKYRSEINNIFEKTGLLYTLTETKTVERVVDNSPLSTEIETAVAQVSEAGIKELLVEAIFLFKQPHPLARKDAVEKIWDALERLKTYYTALNKKASATKIVSDMAHAQPEFIDIFTAEFKTLTDIGNGFRIRHHETSKIDITDANHYDYFFNRCLSLIALAIQYLK